MSFLISIFFGADLFPAWSVAVISIVYIPSTPSFISLVFIFVSCSALYFISFVCPRTV